MYIIRSEILRCMTPEAYMFSLTFVKTRSIMVAEVSVTLVGLSIN